MNENKTVNKRMRKSEKRLILIVILIAIIVISILLVVKNVVNKQDGETAEQKPEEKYVEVSDIGERINKSEKMKEAKYIDDLEVTNIEISQKDGISILKATVKNNTGVEKGDYPIILKMLDENGNEICKENGYIGKIAPGETKTLNVSTMSDIANVYNLEITKAQQPNE